MFHQRCPERLRSGANSAAVGTRCVASKKAFSQEQTNQSWTMKWGGMAIGFAPLKDKAKVGVISTIAAGTSAMLLQIIFGPTIPKL